MVVLRSQLDTRVRVYGTCSSAGFYISVHTSGTKTATPADYIAQSFFEPTRRSPFYCGKKKSHRTYKLDFRRVVSPLASRVWSG